MFRSFVIAIFSVILICFVSSCGIASAISDMFSDDEERESYSNIGQTINYYKMAAAYNGVLESLVTDEHVLLFFSNLFNVESKVVTPSSDLRCNSELVYHINDSGEKVSYSNVDNRIINYSVDFKPVKLTKNGDYLYITTYGKPDSSSGFFMNQFSPKICDSGYSTGYTIDEIEEITIIPLINEVTYLTPLSDNKIGIALNGIPFWSKETYYQDGVKVTEPYLKQLNEADQYLGILTPTNEYHYLVEPLYFTGYNYFNFSDFTPNTYSELSDRSGLVGFAKDGFPIFGPHEIGTNLPPTDLDSCRGHLGQTSLGEVYHYHVKPIENVDESSPSIIGCYSGISN